MSKGSNQRPSQVPKEEVAESWDRIFGKKKETKETKEHGTGWLSSQKHDTNETSNVPIVLS